MKKSYFRVFAVLIAFSLLLTMFAGCKKEEEEEETTTTTKATTTAATTTAATTTQKETEQTTTKAETTTTTEEPGKWDAWEIDPDRMYEYDVVLQVWTVPDIDKDCWGLTYFREKHHIDLNILDISRDKYDELMNIRLGAGEIPDWFIVYDYLTFEKYYNQGVLAGFDPEVYPHFIPIHYYYFQSMVPDAWNHATKNGKVMAIPSGLFTPNQFRRPIVYNGKWMEAVGLPNIPETLDEYYNLMYAFAWNDPDGNGKKDTYGFSDSAFAPIMGAFGGSYCNNPVTGERYWVKRDDSLEYFAVTEDAKKGLEFIKKCYDEEILDPEFITGETLGGYWAGSQLFINGRIGMSALGSYYHWVHKELFAEDEQDVAYDGYNAAECRKIDNETAAKITFGHAIEGPDGYKFMRRSPIYQYEQLAFGVQLEEDLPKVAKWLTVANWQMESFDNWKECFGIEGVHYEFNEFDGFVTINPTDDPDIEMKRMTGYALIGTSAGRLWRSPLDIADDKRWRALGFADNSIENALKVPLPSQADIAPELYKMEDTMIIQIITGDKPLDSFDEFVTDWYDQGGQTLYDEANAWYSSLGG